MACASGHDYAEATTHYFRHVRELPQSQRRGSSWSLLSGGGLELHDQLGGHPAAVLYLDALRFGPLADLGAAGPACPCLAPAPGSVPRTGCSPPARGHVPGQGIAQLLGVLGVQVDFILGAVQAEADRALSLAAVKVIDVQGLYLLGHGCSISSLALSSAWSADAHAGGQVTVL